ncbi:MAG: RNA 2',3'-cyclic phosphodiesterase [Chloroflexota bacterium]
MEHETWRCFVGVPVAPRLRTDLETAMRAWRARTDVPDLRWTDPDAWHVTLAFLGAIDSSVVPELASALRIVADWTDAFPLSTGGVGAFPRPGAAQAIWYGMADPDHRLTDLAARVQAAVLPPGPPARFRPHLTLARSRVPRGEPLGPWLATLEPPSGTLVVDALTLFRSHLGRGPARYEVLASLPLRGAGSGHG